MGAWTIRLLRSVAPEKRLIVSAYIFWISILLGTACTIWVARGGFEKILMAISWLAVTITALDVVLTAEIKDES